MALHIDTPCKSGTRTSLETDSNYNTSRNPCEGGNLIIDLDSSSSESGEDLHMDSDSIISSESCAEKNLEIVSNCSLPSILGTGKDLDMDSDSSMWSESCLGEDDVEFGFYVERELAVKKRTADREHTFRSLINFLATTRVNAATCEFFLKNNKLVIAASGVQNVKMSKTKETALHIAARYNNADLVGVLLAAGCYVNAKDAEGNTPLRRAIRDPNRMTPSPRIIALLINHGASLDPVDLPSDSYSFNIAEGLVEASISDMWMKGLRQLDENRIVDVIIGCELPLDRLVELEDIGLTAAWLKRQHHKLTIVDLQQAIRRCAETGENAQKSLIMQYW